eukprot:CAMPEP_0177690026 /NCGR_PEP_ID=MMETSP0484_2-20121128/525_1 /TAXON_ID=354590 /ORGANISM="Rhodomonas lens, Strain RHODO" /LENGTH=135 /DNA_ID=CAMNT_0019200499 /DNA_START=132 /DNA_END=541 /DNA_ORIENTATION=-
MTGGTAPTAPPLAPKPPELAAATLPKVKGEDHHGGADHADEADVGHRLPVQQHLLHADVIYESAEEVGGDAEERWKKTGQIIEGREAQACAVFHSTTNSQSPNTARGTPIPAVGSHSKWYSTERYVKPSHWLPPV